MELQFAYSATTSIFIIIAIIFLSGLIKVFKRSDAKTLPPGPWKLPIIGSMHHLATGSPPHHTLNKLSKRYGPLMHLKLGEISAVVVSSPQMAKLFLKTHDLSFGGRTSTLATDIMSYNQSEIGFAPCSDQWRELRKICTLELLSKKRVKSFSSIREDEVSNLVEFIRRSVESPINLSAQLFLLTSAITCRAAFGEKFLHQSSLLSLVDEASLLMSGFHLSDLFPSIKFLPSVSGMKSKVENIHKEIDTMFDDIIKKRQHDNKKISRSNEKEDLLDILLRLHQENKQEFHISYINIKAVILEMFMGGTETSASIMEWAMAEMIRNPRVMKKAQCELRQRSKEVKKVKESDLQGMNYLNLVIKETLRLHSPVPLFGPRESTEACEINGYNIAAKTKVIVNMWAIGRDPNFWDDAEKFIPERFEENKLEYNGSNFEYIPFGAGRRICPGVSFGLAMIELVLAQLLINYNWKLPNGIKGEELDMTDSFGLSTKRRNPLFLIAELNEDALVQSWNIFGLSLGLCC